MEHEREPSAIRVCDKCRGLEWPRRHDVFRVPLHPGALLGPILKPHDGIGGILNTGFTVAFVLSLAAVTAAIWTNQDNDKFGEVNLKNVEEYLQIFLRRRRDHGLAPGALMRSDRDS